MNDKATRDYYDTNAEAFFAQTINVDMSPLHQRFLSHLPPRGHILDAGCGSGRDARAFFDHGYQVTAFDASPILADKASQFLGQPVLCRTFDDITEQDEFDGVWACASLLHVARADLSGAIRKLARSLRANGVLYASFKEGDNERVDSTGRHFSDMSAASLKVLLDEVSDLAIIEMWTTTDRRGDRPSQVWWNILASRT